MYLAFVGLTMFALPLISLLVEHALHPEEALLFLVGRWFVFWGVGVRLTVAGVRQFFQPAFTAKQIFHMSGDEALPLVRELGISNFAMGAVGLLSLAVPSFVLPVSISGGLFYGVAGIQHIRRQGRSRNENIAMVGDLFLFALLAVFVIASSTAR